MEDRNATYEGLRTSIGGLVAASDPQNRHLLWVVPQSLAVARNQADCIEVFVAGEPLLSSIRVVEDILEHQTWASAGGNLVAARIVLPRGEHIDRLAAVLCVDLIDGDLASDRQGAFSEVEPMLALALTRNALGDPVLNGLVGELELLVRLLSRAAPAARSDILNAWAGSTPSARDFQLKTVGVEVKTTQGANSTHHVSGVHQVELGSSNDGVAETHLYMLSLGIRWLPEGNAGTSLPALVNSALDLVQDHDQRAGLLARIKQYGGDISIGYDHERDHAKSRYGGRYVVRFERLYDMTDSRLELLSSSQLAGLKDIDSSSVEFDVVLDEHVRGDINPIAGWDAVVPHVLASAGIPEV